MVVMRLPATSLMLVTQLRIALPSTCTVQAPHRPIPQPNFAPVSSSRSRRYHSTGIAGSPSYCLADTLTESCIMPLPLLDWLILYDNRAKRRYEYRRGTHECVRHDSSRHFWN